MKHRNHKLIVSGFKQALHRARQLILDLGVSASVLNLPETPPLLKDADTLMIYLTGQEPANSLERELKRLGRRKPWRGKLMLYCPSPPPEKAALWGQLLERHLPERAEIHFKPREVWGRLNAFGLSVAVRAPAPPAAVLAGGTDVEGLREELGLTQEDLAAAIGVTPRTVQNWEAAGVPAHARSRLRDLFELRQRMAEHTEPAQFAAWLRSPIRAFGESAPIDLIRDRRTRDILVEFHRLEAGEPL